MDTLEHPACCGHTHVEDSPRTALVARALLLEYLTVGWNVLEGLIAVTAASAAGSIALLGFGIDSFVECASGLILIWRLRAEQRHASHAATERVELRARKLVAVSLFALAAYVSLDALHALALHEAPRFSLVGAVLMSVSIALMLWLARAKRALAAALSSEALAADATQTTACWWLSVAALSGMLLNAAFGLWWADPVAGLVIAALVAREGRSAWQGHACC